MPPAIAGKPMARRTIVAHSMSWLPHKLCGAMSMPTAAPIPAPMRTPFQRESRSVDGSL